MLWGVELAGYLDYFTTLFIELPIKHTFFKGEIFGPVLKISDLVHDLNIRAFLRLS